MFSLFVNNKRTTLFREIIRNNSSLIIVEHDNLKYLSSLINVISAAKLFNNEIKCIICGNDRKYIADQVSRVFPFQTCVYVDSIKFTQRTPEYYSDAIAQYIKEDKDITHILAASTSFGKSLIPRIAANFLCAPVSDVTAIFSSNSFQRSIYAGNVLINVKSNDKLKFLTILSTAFEPINESQTNSNIKEITYEVKCKASSKWIEDKITKSDLPELSTAKIIVSGGRGLKSKENFRLIYDLAEKLNAGVGASRAAVDAGYVSNDCQIGQSGKIVAPQLYIAVGISGAIQHITGMKDSKLIVAINKDPDCPIFQVADYGLVEDVFKVLPEMIAKIK